MFSVGIDVHLRSSAVCVLDERGAVVQEFVVRGDPRTLVERLRGIEAPFQVVIEASCGSGTLADLLKPLATRVVVAHPGQLRLIFRSARKNDRVDAKKLAKLLYLDEVPAVHLPEGAVRAWRELVQTRNRTVAKRTRAKNGVRALLRGLLIRTPRALWTGEGRAWLAGVELPSSSARLRRDLLLDEIEYFDRQIKRIDQELSRIAKDHPGVRLLQTIPGVGVRTAEAFCAFVDVPRRFKAKQIGSYLGLVPRQDQSGSINRMGHITRQGPPVVRRLLTEAGWRATHLSPRVKGYFERIRRDDPDRKKIALVATGHYLARVMLAMLQSGELWREEEPSVNTAA
jgi:transposase